MQPISLQSLRVNDRAEMPSIGLGLWKIDQKITADLIVEAAKVGYRHFDSACDYGNEAQAGEGFQRVFSQGICRREEVWITSKLWATYHRPEHVRPALERTLKDLQLDELDLYLMHFPLPLAYVPIEERYPPGWFYNPEAAHPEMKIDRVPLSETWHAMEDLVSAGLVREIGVCNFGTALLRDLIAHAQIPPAVLQIERHPYLTQEKLLRFCREQGIAVTGFSPLGAQSYFSLNMADPEESLLQQQCIIEIAQRVNRTPAQVLMRWGLQCGTSIVPKTSRPDRLRENLSLFDFELSSEEMRLISGLNRHRRFNDPGVFGEEVFNTFAPIYE